MADKWIPLQGVKRGEIHIQITRKVPEMHKIPSLDNQPSLSKLHQIPNEVRFPYSICKIYIHGVEFLCLSLVKKLFMNYIFYDFTFKVFMVLFFLLTLHCFFSPTLLTVLMLTILHLTKYAINYGEVILLIHPLESKIVSYIILLRASDKFSAECYLQSLLHSCLLNSLHSFDL